MNNFLTPEIITALGGSGGLVLVVMWFFLHMAKIQAEDTDKLADRLGKSQTEFKTFAESQMKLMATMNTEMAKVVLAYSSPTSSNCILSRDGVVEVGQDVGNTTQGKNTINTRIVLRIHKNFISSCEAF